MTERSASDGNDPAPDIFLSYARADRSRVGPLAAALEARGLNLWWDAKIGGGAEFARSIESALESADVVIVAWSAHSVGSDWVRDEAGHGRDRGRLVPISLDGTAPPLGFRQYHAIDFSAWRGTSEAPEIVQLLSAIVAAGSGAPRVAPPLPALPRGALRRRAVLIGGAGAVVVLGGGLAGIKRLSRIAVPDNSIAVLPFANLSGDPSQSYFSDGLSEELRTRLGEGGRFKVAAQTSSNLFRGHDSNAITIAEKLGVAYLLDGSVRRDGATVRISAELIEARSGLSKWTQNFDRQLSDIFAVQSEIAVTVMQAIAGALPLAMPALMLAAGTTVVAAYDSYLKGRAIYANAGDAAADRQALASFDAAIAADPHYAQAHAIRADALLDIASNYAQLGQLPAIYRDALASAQRAVSLAPALAAARLAVGNVLLESRLDFRGARPFFDSALALGGHDAKILGQFAYVAVREGRVADALTAIDGAVDLDRLNPLIYMAKGRILYCARRYDEALPLFRRALTMNAGLDWANCWAGFALLQQGQPGLARAAFAAEPLEQQKLTGLAIADHQLHDMPGAQRNFSALQGKFGDRVLYEQALVYTQWQNRDQAFTALARARALNDSGLTWALADPLFDMLRPDPRFKHLLESMGLS